MKGLRGRPTAQQMALRGRPRTGLLDPDTMSNLALAGNMLRTLYQWGQWTKAQGEHAAALDALERNQVSGRLRGARLGEEADLPEAGFSTVPGGLYVGCLGGVPWFYHGDRHGAVMGGSGSGKSSRTGMPQIISSALGTNPQSCVVWDLKGELSWCTALSRSTLDGEPALYFAPWGVPWAMSETFNFLEFLALKSAAGLKVLDKVRSRVALIHANADKGSEASENGWVNKAARRIAICLLAHRAECERELCNPGAMADVATWTQATFAAEMARLALSTAAEGYVADLAAKLGEQYGNLKDDDSAREYGWVMEAYSNAWELYSKGSDLRQAVNKTSFDLAALKRRAQALYILFPDTNTDSHGSFIALVMDALMETLALAPGPVRTNIIADEFVNFPRTAITLKALRLYRDRGVRLVTFTQDRGGFDKYRDEGGFKTFMENSFSLYWGVRDPQTLRDIQEQAGYTTVMMRSQNGSYAMSMDGAGWGVDEREIPVFPTEEIRLIDQGQAILDAPGLRLTVMERPFFRELKFCAPYIKDKFADPMPPMTL